MITLDEIHDAFLFVSSGGEGEHSAFICPEKEQIFYQSEMSGTDELLEEDIEEDDCIAIPHKNDLDLGQQLVFEFVDSHLPADYDRVRQIFGKRGAYRRFKDLLEDKGLLELWYDFENQREMQALREWCLENEIAFSEGEKPVLPE